MFPSSRIVSSSSEVSPKPVHEEEKSRCASSYIPKGIFNNGASCEFVLNYIGYLNSVTQCLMRTEPFFKAVDEYQGDSQIANAFKETIREYYAKKCSNVVRLHRLLAAKDEIFAVGRMSDAYFALCKIFALFDEEVKGPAELHPTKFFCSSLVNRCRLLCRK